MRAFLNNRSHLLSLHLFDVLYRSALHFKNIPYRRLTRNPIMFSDEIARQ